MLSNHGPVVDGKDIEAACNAIKELQDTARLAMLTLGLNPRMLNAAEQQVLITKFDIEWHD